MERREFIKKTTVTGTLLTGMQLTDMLKPHKSEAVGKKDDERPLVAICASNDPELPDPAPINSLLSTHQIRDIVWKALDRDTSPKNLINIIRKDSWVVIKPNIVTIPLVQDKRGDLPTPNWNLVREYDENVEHWGLVTDLRVMKALVEYIVERIGPRRVTFAEGAPWYSSGGKLKPNEKFVDGWHVKWKGYDNLSYAGIVEEMNRKQSGTKFDFIDLNEDEAVYVTDYDPHKTGLRAFQFVPPGDSDGTSDNVPTHRKGIYLPRTIMERDILITCPVLKTHGSAGTTLFMKNFVGCVHSQTYGDGNMKVPIHRGSRLNLTRGIADLGAAINPDYGVAEGFWALMNMHWGQNGVNINHNVVIAGGDVVAAEAVAIMAMGFNPLDSDMLRLCNIKKLGEWHPDKINIAGPPVKSIRRNYARAANMYTARGIRKWLMLGPLKKPLDDPLKLNPRLGEETAGKSWKLLDGDEIIDNDPQATNKEWDECLPYTIPGSETARKKSLFYLCIRINTHRKDLVGQLLVGIKGGEFRAFFDGDEKKYSGEPFRYDITNSRFMKFRSGDNPLVLEITKTNNTKEPVKIAVNICDLDGDRLMDITLDPAGE